MTSHSSYSSSYTSSSSLDHETAKEDDIDFFIDYNIMILKEKLNEFEKKHATKTKPLKKTDKQILLESFINQNDIHNEKGLNPREVFILKKNEKSIKENVFKTDNKKEKKTYFNKILNYFIKNN